MGCNSPNCLIDSASSNKESSSKFFLGCSLFGSTKVILTVFSDPLSRTAVTNSMRLLKLCDEVQQMIIDDMITTGHARALISIEDKEQQYMVAQKIKPANLSARHLLSPATISKYVFLSCTKMGCNSPNCLIDSASL